MAETYLITGGAGFVGVTLGLLFKEANPNLRIVALDNLKRRGSELNLPRLKKAGIEFHHGDIRNPEDLNFLKEISWIIECSAEPSVLTGYQDSPDYAINTNLLGTIHCLELARRTKARMLFLSTSRIYPMAKLKNLKLAENSTRLDLAKDSDVAGVSPEGISEKFPLEGARTLYGTTKLCSEIIFEEYRDMYQVEGFVNRCSVLGGPWQMGKVDQGVMGLWVAKHFFNKELSYIGFKGLGKQVRDVLHVHDLYRLVSSQMKEFKRHNGQVYNVGGGLENSFSLLELTELCRKATGNKIPIHSDPKDRLGDVPWYVSDCRKVKEACKWKPEKNLEMIVKDIVSWLESNKKDLEAILA